MILVVVPVDGRINRPTQQQLLHEQGMKPSANLSIASPPPRITKKEPLVVSMHLSKGNITNSGGSGANGASNNTGNVTSSQQRLYIAPQSSIRPPDTETTTALTQIDTNARRRRQPNNNNNSIDFSMIATTTTTTYSPQSSPSERSNTHLRTYGGSVSKKKKLLQYASTMTPIFRRSSHRCHDSDYYSSSNCHDDDDSGNDDDDDDELIMAAPSLWMDDMEGGNVTIPVAPIHCEAASRQRKYHPKSGQSQGSGKKRTIKKKNFHNSASSIKSDSKFNNSNRHVGDHSNDDDHSVHTYHTVQSLQHEVQSKLTIDLGGAGMIGSMTPAGNRSKGGMMGMVRSGHKRFAMQQPPLQTRPRRTFISKCGGHFGRPMGNIGGMSSTSHNDDNKSRCLRFLFPLLQGMLCFVLIYILYDSRRRNILHQQQLLQLDEERAHILEQMTWIDTAAKKVHKKYGQASIAANNGLLTNMDETKHHSDSAEVQLYKDDNKQLQSKIDMLQLRVQQNARTRTSIQFGDEPVQVSLPISEGNVANEHFVIALSDDAPHAVNTFLQQVTIGLWNVIDFQQMQNGRIIQASTRYADTKPILEFVEQSRGCHTAGSVALHQLESDEFHVMVLKIHMDASATVDTDDVCIGNIVKGFDSLESILPQLPTIQSGNEDA